MTQYLGISMVVIVAALCVGILSTIVSENIFKQVEAHRRRTAKATAELLLGALRQSSEYVGKYIGYAKEAVKMDQKYGENGKVIAKDAFNKTFNEMKEDFEGSRKE